MTVDEINAIFFGYASYRSATGDDFVGVWGTRNASKLRRLLRSNGVELVVHRQPPPARLHHWVTHGRARAHAVGGATSA
jgi:hypothetical protein